MKKLILSLILLLSILLISCEKQAVKQSNTITSESFIIKDIRGNMWQVKDYNNYPNVDEINFIDIDGTKVVIHGNYTIQQLKE